jgi:hypothetical protein
LSFLWQTSSSGAHVDENEKVFASALIIILKCVRYVYLTVTLFVKQFSWTFQRFTCVTAIDNWMLHPLKYAYTGLGYANTSSEMHAIHVHKQKISLSANMEWFASKGTPVW